MNILETIERAGFVATEPQVEALAGQVSLGNKANGTYLKVLVAVCQAEMKGKRRDQMAIVDQVNERLYAATLRGVGGDEVDMPERIRRAAFAATSTSTLRTYIRSGGNLRLLVPAEVTKTSLRMMSTVPEPASRSERIFRRARDAIIRRFKLDAKRDPTSARDALNDLISDLQGQLETLNETHVTSMVGVTKTHRPVQHAHN